MILDTDFDEPKSTNIQLPEPLAMIIDRLCDYCDDKTLQGDCGSCPFFINNANQSECSCFVVNKGYGIPANWVVYEENELKGDNKQ